MEQNEIKPDFSNSCQNCRYLKTTSIDYLPGVAYFNCKKHYHMHPLYGKVLMKCTEVREDNPEYCTDWELGGFKGFISRLKNKFK